MIQVFIKNMSCGHCQLKINATLKAHHYDVLNINMDNSSVMIDSPMEELPQIKHVLDDIGYLLESEDAIEYNRTHIWDSKLDDEENYEAFTSFLDEQGISIEDFEEDPFGLILLITPKQYQTIQTFVSKL